MAESSEVGKVFLRLGINSEDVAKDLKDAEKQVGKTFNSGSVNKFNKSLSNTHSASDKLSGTLNKLGKTIAVAFSVKKVIDFTKECVKAANAQQAVETKLATVMKQRMGASDASIQSVKNLASELQKVGVVGDEVALAGAAQFATFTNSEKAVKSLLPAMENLAVSMKGVDVSSEDMVGIANQVGKALANGNLSSLTRSGITVTDAELARWKQLTTDEEKAAFLAQVITNNVGDMNKAMRGTYAGSVVALKNAFGDLKETIGGMIQQVLMPAIQILTDIVKALQGAVNKFKESMGFNTVQKEEEAVAGTTQKVAKNLTKATTKAKELQRTLMGFDKINKLEKISEDTSDSFDIDDSALDNTKLGDAGALQVKVDADISPFQKKMQEIGSKYISPALETVGKQFGEWFGTLAESEGFKHFKDSFGKLLADIPNDIKWIWEHVLVPFGDWLFGSLFPVLADGLGAIIDTIRAIKGPLGELYDEIFVPMAGVVGKALIFVLQKLVDMQKAFAKWVKENPEEYKKAIKILLIGFASIKAFKFGNKLGLFIEGILPKIISLGSTIGKVCSLVSAAVVKLGSIIGSVCSSIVSAITSINPVFAAIAAGVALIGGLIALNWDDLKKLFDAEYWAEIGQSFVEIIAYVGEKIGGFFSGIWDGICKGVSGAINWVKEKIGGFVDWLGKKWKQVTDFFGGIGEGVSNAASSAYNWGKGKLAGAGKWISNNIPHFANGGYVQANSPQLAVIGDNPRYGEAVMNDAQIASLISQAGNGGNAEVVALLTQILALLGGMNLEATIDGSALTNLVVKMINQKTRSTGNCPIYT